jgi:hypothetical protein
VAEVCIRYKCDPFEEMVKLAMECVRVPDNPAAMEELLKTHEFIMGEDGKQRMRLKAMDRFDILKECAQYVYPRLRSSETKIEEDKTLTIVLRTFSNGQAIDTPVTSRVVDIPILKKLGNGA